MSDKNNDSDSDSGCYGAGVSLGSDPTPTEMPTRQPVDSLFSDTPSVDPPTDQLGKVSLGPAVWVPRKETPKEPGTPKVTEYYQRSTKIQAAEKPFMSAPPGWQPPPPGFRCHGDYTPHKAPGSSPQARLSAPGSASKPSTPQKRPNASVPKSPLTNPPLRYNPSIPAGKPSRDYAVWEQKLRDYVDKQMSPAELAREKAEREDIIAQGLASGAGSWWIQDGVKAPYTPEQKAAALRKMAEEDREMEKSLRDYEEFEKAEEKVKIQRDLEAKAAHKKYTNLNTKNYVKPQEDNQESIEPFNDW